MAPPIEFQLLLDAALPGDAPRVDLGRLTPAQWQRAAELAAWHRLAPLLHTHLAGRAEVPSKVRDSLEAAYLANTARNLFMADALATVVHALDDAGVPTMLLKGAALVETVYADPGEREMLDLDVLVPSAQLGSAYVALTPLGYRPLPPADGVEPTAVVSDPSAHHHAPGLTGEHGLLAVELHHHISIAGEGIRFDIEEMWQRARRSPRGPHHLPTPEDLLLHVCLHFTRNRLGGSYRHVSTGGALAGLADIGRLVAGEPLDWSALATAARRYRLDARVFLALFAARDLGAAVPADALADLRPPGFDHRLGRRLVTLRVLLDGAHPPVRSLRHALAPGREVLARGWNADAGARLSLARAWVRRARAQAPRARVAARRPWAFVQDQRLNNQIRALEEHA